MKSASMKNTSRTTSRTASIKASKTSTLISATTNASNAVAKNYKIIPPKQKYLTLDAIYEEYGSRPVAAYRCKLQDNAPVGGYIIAVLNHAEGETDSLKRYIKHLKSRYTAKEPIYFLRVEKTKAGTYLVTHDNGEGEIKSAPKIELKKSKTQSTLEETPDDVLALALITALLSSDE